MEKAKPRTRPGGSSRGVFLSLMGAVYFCAFTSFYLQYPGLLGEDGLLPARKSWEEVRASRSKQVDLREPLGVDLNVPFAWWVEGLLKKLQIPSLPKLRLLQGGEGEALRGFLSYPSWLWFIVDGRPSLQVDQALEGIALAGAALSLLAFLGAHHITVFSLLYVSYLTLYSIGQRWLGFQWDIFLLETGAMMLLYCPLFTIRASGACPPAAWLLRALVVKFMYMNGVVKVTANCPTWKHLTALEFHFVSTCLPTAPAWILHQLPPFVLRMGTAFMFLTELPAPFLLLCPITAVRRIGVLIQAPLQFGVMLTGNYNWFNAHFLALLVPAWAADEYEDEHAAWPLRMCTMLPRMWGRFWSGRIGVGLAAVGVTCLGVWTATLMFQIKLVGGGTVTARVLAEHVFGMFAGDGLRVNSLFGVRDVEKLSAVVLSPRSLQVFFAFVCVSCLRYVAAACSHRGGLFVRFGLLVGRLAVCLLVVPMMVVCLLPCEQVHRGASIAIPYSSTVRPLDRALQPWHVATSYGLFRRMTGVGSAPPGSEGWGGLPPSVPAVPAVVVEGSDDGREWKEIPFRYAPGSTRRMPRRTAPHQPRLDWQMWFAALGSYEQNPWFVHFLYKLLSGSKDVLDLLDVDAAPWPQADRPPKYVRSILYHYDFTRLDTPWARSVPGLPILNATSGPTHSEWWSRTKVRDYTPAVDLDSLKGVVEQQGWQTKKKQRSAALSRVKNCTSAYTRSHAVGRCCDAIVGARKLRQSPNVLRSGWNIQSSAFSALWPGASSEYFLDIHFLLIMAPLAVVLTLKAVLDLCCKHPFGRTTSVISQKAGSNPKTKTKTE